MAKLENELARTRSSIKALGIIIAILVVMSVVWAIVADVGGGWADGRRLAAPPNEVRAKKFVLVDDKGITRALLAASEDGTALDLWDESGKPRAALSALKDAPALALWDEKGNTRVGLYVSKDGPGLALYDKNEKMLWQVP